MRTVTKPLATLVLLLLLCTWLQAADTGRFYEQYRKLISDPSLSVFDGTKKTREFLKPLSKPDFLTFIREAASDPNYLEGNEGWALLMALFAKSYMEGPGKGEPLTDTVRQLEDRTLPTMWKLVLLDALHLTRHPDLQEPKFEPVMSLLERCGKDRRNTDRLRCECLLQLRNILQTQKELLLLKAPDLKAVVEKQDQAALVEICGSQPTREDAAAARKLVSRIVRVRDTLRDVAEEIQDERLKDILRMHADKMEPIQKGPKQDKPVP